MATPAAAENTSIETLISVLAKLVRKSTAKLVWFRTFLGSARSAFSTGIIVLRPPPHHDFKGMKLENEWFATALADICVRSASELISVIVTRMTSTPLRNNDQILIASFGLEDF
jgi:hypothetical protein